MSGTEQSIFNLTLLIIAGMAKFYPWQSTSVFTLLRKKSTRNDVIHRDRTLLPTHRAYTDCLLPRH
jgi:hypothetical protein